MTYYTIYKQNGILKRGALNENAFKMLQKNPSVSDVSYYVSQQLMESAYAQEKGIDFNQKSLLLG
jgi:hypothetical protein